MELEGPIPVKYEVDHIDGNPSNNRRDNLRIVTSSQNKFNTKKNVKNSTGIKGVHWDSGTQMYRVRFRVNGKFKHFGLFQTLEEAKTVSELKRKELHGDYFRE